MLTVTFVIHKENKSVYQIRINTSTEGISACLNESRFIYLIYSMWINCEFILT